MVYKASINNFRSNLADYLNKVHYSGATVEIHKFGKVMAVLKAKDTDTKEKKLDLYHGFLGKGNESGIAFENRVRRSKKERNYIRKLTG